MVWELALGPSTGSRDGQRPRALRPVIPTHCEEPRKEHGTPRNASRPDPVCSSRSARRALRAFPGSPRPSSTPSKPLPGGSRKGRGRQNRRIHYLQCRQGHTETQLTVARSCAGPPTALVMACFPPQHLSGPHCSRLHSRVENVLCTGVRIPRTTAQQTRCGDCGNRRDRLTHQRLLQDLDLIWKDSALSATLTQSPGHRSIAVQECISRVVCTYAVPTSTHEQVPSEHASITV